jgi:NAD(P)-dependent dehydrogenase (short-subunit alcohol dehydrogenase family)
MDKKKNFNQQTILIAGGTGNVGGGAAVSLAKRGAHVVLMGRNLETLEARAAAILDEINTGNSNPPGAKIDTLVIDFTDLDDVRRAAEEALDRFPRIDGLILSVVTLIQNGPTILPNGHEIMFATNVLGPFLFTQLLIERLKASDGLILHVVVRFHKEIDWDDLESIQNHDTDDAYHRTKTCNRAIAAELARRYAGQLSSVAFDPGFIIDKNDPELAKRWPSGFTGFYWRVLTLLIARSPEVAGEPIADLVLNVPDRNSINGALFKLGKRVEKPYKAMDDEALGEKLWTELEILSGLAGNDPNPDPDPET